MNTLKQQRKTDTFTVCDILNENEKVIGWTVSDNNLERITDKNFNSAYEAFVWASENYRGLL